MERSWCVSSLSRWGRGWEHSPHWNPAPGHMATCCVGRSTGLGIRELRLTPSKGSGELGGKRGRQGLLAWYVCGTHLRLWGQQREPSPRPDTIPAEREPSGVEESPPSSTVRRSECDVWATGGRAKGRGGGGQKGFLPQGPDRVPALHSASC